MAGLCEGGNEPPGSLKAIGTAVARDDYVAEVCRDVPLVDTFEVEHLSFQMLAYLLSLLEVLAEALVVSHNNRWAHELTLFYPILSYSILSHHTLSYTNLLCSELQYHTSPYYSYLILIYHILPYPTPLLYPILSYPVLPYPTLLYHILSYPTLPYLTLPYPMLPYPTLPDPILFYLTLIYPLLSHLTLPYSTLSCPILSYLTLLYPILSSPILPYPTLPNLILSYPTLPYSTQSYPLLSYLSVPCLEYCFLIITLEVATGVVSGSEHVSLSVLNCEETKINCLFFLGPSNSGKSFIAQDIAHHFITGYVTCANSLSEFTYENFLNKSLILLEEPFLTDGTCDDMKNILAGAQHGGSGDDDDDDDDGDDDDDDDDYITNNG
ncbi:hypothetical protein ANN_05306 [Periplaneta americana]|uniref:Parvovirus non-structural protein 1 helicase domain-containing protein n=1 Tax=Periplaneta americana TaxID=6978 RepID=A0ABQ8TCM3_PERAM|nr:hypothetical protein ANN_05306 [Periplaneta americana]